MIHLDCFQVDYPGFRLGPLTLDIVAGERVALIGANGAGKSTTLRGLAGLLREYRGRVTVGGCDVSRSGSEVRARLGFVPERLLGFGWMTVAEHLEALADFYPTWDPAYADALRIRLDLPAKTRLANLSRGMQLKLSLVGAEAHRPPMLLLDEPTSGIDPVMRKEILGMILDFTDETRGRTVLFSSHLLEDIEAVAERVVMLGNGQIVGDAHVSALLGEERGRSLSEILLDRLSHAD